MTRSRAINTGNTGKLLPLAQGRRTVPNHSNDVTKTLAGKAGRAPETDVEGLIQAARRPRTPGNTHTANLVR